MTKADPLDELLAEIARISDPETLIWLEGEAERWSELARGLELVAGCFDRIVQAVKARRAELAANQDSGGEP